MPYECREVPQRTLMVRDFGDRTIRVRQREHDRAPRPARPARPPLERDEHFDADNSLSAYAADARERGRVVT
jgi:Protein of unknown function (DUF2958)